MSVQENIDLVKRWFHEVWNEGKIETIHELMSPDGVATGQGDLDSVLRGPAEFAAFAKGFQAAFSKMEMRADDIFGVDDKVVIRWSATMVHSGDAFGVQATGKQVRISGISVARISKGKVVEGWDNWSQLALLQQIGAFKEPEAPPLKQTA